MQKYLAFIKQFVNFFRRHGDDDRKLMDKLRDKYRLVVMNDDTFEEVTSIKLTLWARPFWLPCSSSGRP
jgi:hypothetical protein